MICPCLPPLAEGVQGGGASDTDGESPLPIALPDANLRPRRGVGQVQVLVLHEEAKEAEEVGGRDLLLWSCELRRYER